MQMRLTEDHRQLAQSFLDPVELLGVQGTRLAAKALGELNP
jgi:hypothetical protein